MTQEEFNKFDKDYEVCICMGVCLDEIQDAIKSGCNSVESIGDKTDAGSVCGQCRSKEDDSGDDREIHLDEILEFTI